MTEGTGVSFEVKRNIQALTDKLDERQINPLFFRLRVAYAASGGGCDAETEVAQRAGESSRSVIARRGQAQSILPYTKAEWEKLSIFLTFLIPKLPAPKEEDLSKGILEAIDMDSYRVEKRAAMQIQLPDQDAEIEPADLDGGGRKPEPELDRLSNILKTFNDQFGKIESTDADRIRKMIAEEIPARVAADTAYQNAMKHSDKQNARIEHDKALAPCDRGTDEGRHRALQAVQRQRRI